MRTSKHMQSWLALWGACIWIGSMVGCSCGDKKSTGRDSGVLATGGVVGSDGGARAGTGGATAGAGGTHAPDAATGTVLGTGGRFGAGGRGGAGGTSGNGGSMGSGGAFAVDAGGRLCGTIAGLTCGGGEFCDLDSKCGTIHDAPGTCEATGPQVACTREYRPVCGCDGITYGNDCTRRAAGVLKLKDGLCGGPLDGGMGGQAVGGAIGGGGASGAGGAGGATGTGVAPTYLGCYWAGGLDHVTLQKQDLAKDECIVLMLDAPSSSLQGYEVTLPTNWGLRSAIISSCGSAGSGVAATVVTGTISWGAGTTYPPETANVDVVLHVTVLDGGPTFTYLFSAQDIELKYGC